MESMQLDSELENTVTELRIIAASLGELKPGTDKAKEIRGVQAMRFNDILDTMPHTLKRIADNGQDPEIVNDKLKDSFDLINEILKKMTVLKAAE